MTVAEVRDAVAVGLPGYEIESVAPIGDGLDNFAYEVNRDLIVRISKDPDPERTAHEGRLLDAVAAVAPVPVPSPAFVIPERGCLAYYKLAGVPLLDRSQRFRDAHAERVVAALGDLLTALHTIRPADAEIDDESGEGSIQETADLYATVAAHVPPFFRGRIESFLCTGPPAADYELVFSHNDLGIEHVLVDESGTVTGVIDWSDAALVDPACDYGRLYRDLGPPALAVTDPALIDRAVFYARCAVVEDLAYGLETGRSRYAEKSLTALEWLFPA
ncbi:aminoglycoside phosphotransferase (APT) family kinase protein [Actinoplanes octamycinicus]|uniref:Aminoglycoside phosphotransferase (APT) family kinase protein n=1 Tax=Actinoplanes octamycinicus TaxID=135948 RepID=A0A7W7MAZ0_9ACTN|nr:phosphotransferase [Actinoplanes octamycinicus]MBB4743569.1 aminoglycoside phosphotransferase (APT) family kinase protein [Actinoplanes octamycinicus]GIE62442.1 hypothetical protein Aoc01nite_78440 [Actinoplanes octamycinicus]